MQLRMSPGGSMPNSLRRTPELPPSSVTVTIAVRCATDQAPSASTYALSPRRSVDRPVPPPIATMFRPCCRIQCDSKRRMGAGEDTRASIGAGANGGMGVLTHARAASNPRCDDSSDVMAEDAEERELGGNAALAL